MTVFDFIVQRFALFLWHILNLGYSPLYYIIVGLLHYYVLDNLHTPTHTITYSNRNRVWILAEEKLINRIIIIRLLISLWNGLI